MSRKIRIGRIRVLYMGGLQLLWAGGELLYL